MTAPTDNQPKDAQPASNKPASLADAPTVAPKRSNYMLLFTLLIAILGIAWFLYWYFYLSYYQSTDDAYANGNFIVVNSAIPGSVVSYYADNTDLVNEGQLLVQLDRTNYQVTFDRELATLASVVLEVRQLYDNVKISQANLDNRKATLERTQYDFNNRSNLVGSGAVSNEDFVHAKNDLAIAEYNFRQAQFQLQSAEAAAGNTPVEQHPLIEKQKSNVRSAYYNLRHCSIYAPATGYVAQRTVEVGKWVTPQTALMAIIPTTYVWVDANFKETQLYNMRIGQPATVWLDIYGSKVKYEGKVLGIASGTGSVFSLIPPQNATGNWIKIVQRLPVRISLDPETVQKYPLRLGLSANVDVDVRNQDLPLLAPVASTAPVGETAVFDIEMQAANKMIDTIVQENLSKQKLE